MAGRSPFALDEMCEWCIFCPSAPKPVGNCGYVVADPLTHTIPFMSRVYESERMQKQVGVDGP